MRIVALLVVLLISGTVVAELPEPETLEREVGRAWYADVERWADYAFRRRVTRQSFDADDKVTFRQDMEFRVTPKEEGFDELLVEMDGREPTSYEIRKHRGKATFTKHYRQAAELELSNPIGENLALLPLIAGQEHRLVGEDEVDGVPCYRTRFDARPEPSGASAREKVKYAVKGTACFSMEGYHLVVFEMETVRPLKEKGVTVNSLKLTIEGQAVGDGWVPKLVQQRTDAKALGKRMRKANTWRYDQFRYRPAR